MILRVNYYVCLSRYRRIGQSRFNLADSMKMVMFSRYVWILLCRGLVRRSLRFSRITRGRRTWHKTQCARRTRSTSTCDPPFCGSLFFRGDVWLFEFEFLSSATSRRCVCYTFCRARRRGDAFRRAVCSVRLNRVLRLFAFSYNNAEVFFLVQLVSPVLGTSISKKSGIVGVY